MNFPTPVCNSSLSMRPDSTPPLCLHTQIPLTPPPSISVSSSVSNFSSIFLSVLAARCFRYRYHKPNPGNTNPNPTTETTRPTAALALALRPLETGFTTEDCVPTKLAVFDVAAEDVGDAAPKIVETVTLTNAVAFAFASAMCTANEPFSPQAPQSGTSRKFTNQVATADWYRAGSAVALAGLATE